jgi:hypothetical protein
MIGFNPGKPMTKLRRFLVVVPKDVLFLDRLCLFFLGIVWIDNIRPKIDYSKWLGPDYVYRYDKYGIQTLNHSSLIV